MFDVEKAREIADDDRGAAALVLLRACAEINRLRRIVATYERYDVWQGLAAENERLRAAGGELYEALLKPPEPNDSRWICGGQRALAAWEEVRDERPVA